MPVHFGRPTGDRSPHKAGNQPTGKKLAYCQLCRVSYPDVALVTYECPRNGELLPCPGCTGKNVAAPHLQFQQAPEGAKPSCPTCRITMVRSKVPA